MACLEAYRGKSRALGVGLCVFLGACSGNDTILEGDRIPVRESAVPAIDPEAAGAVALTKAVTNSEWTHLNGATSHFAGHVAGEYPLEPVWRASIGRGDYRDGRITSGPIVAGGLIYTLDSVGQITAFTEAGSVAWSRSLALPDEREADGYGGGLSFGNGTLVVGSGYGEVVALEPETGAVRWRQEMEAPVRSAPTVLGNLAFVVARNDQAFGIDLENGRIRWRTSGVEPEAGIGGGASPAARDGLVVIPFASGEVVGAVTRTGRRAWTSYVSGGRRGTVRGRLSDITGDPVIAGDTIFVANQSGQFAALDRRDGARVWSVSEGSFGPALPVGNSVFFVTDQGEIKRLRAGDGAEVWSVALPEFENAERLRGAYLHSGPVLVGGRLLVASSDGLIRSFDPDTGEALGTVSIGGDGAAAQPAVANGRVYVVTRNGTLVALQ